jgi:hypothetical protein
VDRRHAKILNVIKKKGVEAGIEVSIEPRIPGVDRKKPDLDFEFSNNLTDDMMSDLSIIHSTATSYVHISIEAQLYNRAKTKTAKYLDFVRNADRKFKAFEVTSYGVFGPNARAVVQLFAQHADDMLFTEESKEFADSFYDEILIELMIGNAKIIRQCHTKSLHPSV